MEAYTLQVLFDSLQNRQTESREVQFARSLAQQMLDAAGSETPLRPIFTHLNGEHPGWYVSGTARPDRLQLPAFGQPPAPDPDARARLEEALAAIAQQEEQLELLLDTLEQWGSGIPAAEDISVCDYRRMVAALASCAVRCSGPLTDDASLFLLYTADFSGIQKFIYTVPTSGALKTLRSRSFFLELAMVHYIDELLNACGLCRANLLYSGGGHCYLMLPNTPAVHGILTEWNTRFNDWLLKNFGSNLYLADACTPCCGNDLTNTPQENAPYRAMFRRLSANISHRKLCRYTPGQLRALNEKPRMRSLLECHVCGTDTQLQFNAEGRATCRWCHLFITLSNKILQSDLFIVHAGTSEGFQMPGYRENLYFLFTGSDKADAGVPREEIRRVYGKNQIFPDMPHCIRLSVGDYATRQETLLLAKASQGISRLGICRMDVDNLGHAFVAGFEQDCEDPVRRQHYVNLIRTGAFSRQISLFFKSHINQILSGEFENREPLEVMIVYSGGDDVFLAGAWTDILEASLRIRNAFSLYTCGSLTLSAGIGMFHPSHPVRLAAKQTAVLEEEAKNLPEKNGISLLMPEAGHAYSWHIYETKVLQEKLALLQDYYTQVDRQGRSFLYPILNLLQTAGTSTAKTMPIARLAYYLAQVAPTRSAPDREKYDHFSKTLYRWALDPEDRRQLTTAIILYIYQNRKVRDLNDRTQ